MCICQNTLQIILHSLTTHSHTIMTITTHIQQTNRHSCPCSCLWFSSQLFPCPSLLSFHFVLRYRHTQMTPTNFTPTSTAINTNSTSTSTHKFTRVSCVLSRSAPTSFLCSCSVGVHHFSCATQQQPDQRISWQQQTQQQLRQQLQQQPNRPCNGNDLLRRAHSSCYNRLLWIWRLSYPLFWLLYFDACLQSSRSPYRSVKHERLV